MDSVLAIRKLDEHLEAVLHPFREAIERLTTIPGVSQIVAQVIVAEMGRPTGNVSS